MSQHLIAHVPERNRPGEPLEEAEALASELSIRGDAHNALRLLSQAPADAPLALPILATAGDIREVVQFLKKKPRGVTIVEAMDADKKRVFEPRKVTAYEFWGIITRSGDRLKLSPLGWEFAWKLEPEAHIYRAVLDRTKPYRAVLEWICEQRLEIVTHIEVAAYWHNHHPETLEQHNEKTIEGNVVCFFHLCQAAELGTVTIGKRGQPARLRVDHDELLSYIEAPPIAQGEDTSAGNGDGRREEGRGEASRREPFRPATVAPQAITKKPRVFISHGKNTRVVEQIQTSLELADIESEAAGRERDASGSPVAEEAFRAMRRCAAGVIVVSGEDCERDSARGEYTLAGSILLEIAAAFVLYDRRVVLLWDSQLPIPFNLRNLDLCQFERGELTWDGGMQLLKFIKDFKGRDSCQESSSAN